MIVVSVLRRLTAEQRALLLSFAELDTEIDGTINGLTQTKSGKRNFRIFISRVSIVLCLGNRVINDDDYPLLKSIRDALSNLPLGSRKVAETIDEQETDTKRDGNVQKKKSKN